MTNKYFRYWGIKEPVFLSNEKRFYPSTPFQPLLERLTTQLYVGMKFQVLQGPPSSGKTTLLRQISRSLSVEEWDVLYLSTLSLDTPSHTFSQKLLRFLDTTSVENDLPSLPKIIKSLERLSKSKRKILVLLDVHETTVQLQELESEIVKLAEVVTYHNLCLYLIAASPQGRLESAKSTSEWTGHLRPLLKEEASGYLKWCLCQAQIHSDLISEELIQKLYRDANGSMLKLSQLAESILIDLSLSQPGAFREPETTLDPGSGLPLKETNYENHSQNRDKVLLLSSDLETSARNLDLKTQASDDKEVLENALKSFENRDSGEILAPSEPFAVQNQKIEPESSRDLIQPDLGSNILTNIEPGTLRDRSLETSEDSSIGALGDQSSTRVNVRNRRGGFPKKTITDKPSHSLPFEKAAMGKEDLEQIQKLEGVKTSKKGSNPLVSLISLTKGI